jgi:hypothetical protein
MGEKKKSFRNKGQKQHEPAGKDRSQIHMYTYFRRQKTAEGSKEKGERTESKKKSARGAEGKLQG